MNQNPETGSWGNYPQARTQHVHRLHWRNESLPAAGRPFLPRGLGRSYGDTCLNDGGTLLDTLSLDHFVRFDRETGRLCCEAGTSLEAVLDLATPHGWFLPVTPGTRHVTVGGALANDVHGKNHHRVGTFGCFVERFELVRSNGLRSICSPSENSELFCATIGGLGLTGLLTWVEFRLRQIENPMIQHESIRFSGLDEFFDLAAESDRTFEYTVAWIDCLARGKRLGRGLFLRGNHAVGGVRTAARPRPGRISVPFYAPPFLLNRFTLGAFNSLYYRKQLQRVERGTSHVERFFYPLDGISGWNRLYGRRGFLQYQCVVPHQAGRDAVRALIDRVARSGEASFLAVLKIFGDRLSPGLLSFPTAGVTLALDFPHRGPSTLALLEQLDVEVRRCGGRVYPAKDARMSAQSFQQYYPQWREFRRFVDPEFSSGFWRRVTGSEQAA